MLSKKLGFVALVGLLAATAGVVVLRKVRRHWHDPSHAAVSQVMRVARPLDTSDAAQAIFDGKLGAGWADWGWGPHELSNGSPIRLVMSGYGGLILRHDSLGGHYGMLSFRYKAPADWSDFLQVTLKTSLSSDAQLPDVAVDDDHTKTQPDGWREVRLDLAQLNPQGAPFDRLVISARTSVASDWVSLDKIVLSKPAAGAPISAAPNRSATLRVSCNARAHAISPLIYGAADGDWESGQTALRIGGNPTSRFNWELGAWNAANDWFFENGKSFDLASTLDDTVKHHGFSALTVPLIGWVAKDTTSVGFPGAKFPGQRKYDPNRDRKPATAFAPTANRSRPGHRPRRASPHHPS